MINVLIYYTSLPAIPIDDTGKTTPEVKFDSTSGLTASMMDRELTPELLEHIRETGVKSYSAQTRFSTVMRTDNIMAFRMVKIRAV